MSPERVYAAMIRGTASEFWAVVGPSGDPAPPCARSKEEFELRLAAEGMELSGREAAPEEAGLPAGFCAGYGVRVFEVVRRAGPETQAV